jgi:hypothetical protein
LSTLLRYPSQSTCRAREGEKWRRIGLWIPSGQRQRQRVGAARRHLEVPKANAAVEVGRAFPLYLPCSHSERSTIRDNARVDSLHLFVLVFTDVLAVDSIHSGVARIAVRAHQLREASN